MIYGYIRVSTDKQTVENQRFEITEYAKKNNLPIDQWIDADDMGNYPIQMSYVQITMAKPTSGKQYTMLIPGLEAIYRNAPISQPIPGDVNGDGTITAADVTALYDVLLNNDTTHLVNGDQNGDNNITAADITAVYDILLGAK